MSQQPKSSNVCNRMHRRNRVSSRRNQFVQSLSRCPVQSSHRLSSGPHRALANLPLLQTSSNYSSPNRFSQNQNIPGPRPNVFPNFPRINQASDCITKFQFLVPNRVTAQNGSTSLSNLAQSAAHNFFQQIRRSARRKSHNRKRRNRTPAHGINIAQSIGGRHLPKRKRLIHNRRKKIHRLHHSQFRRQLINPGIIRSLKSHKHIRVSPARQPLQNLLQNRRTQLSSTPSSLSRSSKLHNSPQNNL